MVTSTFSLEKSLKGAAHRHDENRWRVHPLDMMDWNQFLKYLADLHGPSVLLNPEGEPLALRDPNESYYDAKGKFYGYAVPAAPTYRPHKYTRRKRYNELPEGYYHGDADDTRLQDRKVKVPNESAVHTLAQAYMQKHGPSSPRDIAEHYGIEYRQIQNGINKYSGTLFRVHHRKGRVAYWEVINGEGAQEEQEDYGEYQESFA